MKNLKDKILETRKLMSSLNLNDKEKEPVFAAILTTKLLEHNVIKEDAASAGEREINRKPSFDKLSKTSNFPDEELEKVFDLESEGLRVILPSNDNKSQNAVNATYLILLGSGYIFNKNKLKASEIKDALLQSRISVPTNFGSLLSKETGKIQRVGKAKSVTCKYYLARGGKEKALEILRELLKDEQEEQSNDS